MNSESRGPGLALIALAGVAMLPAAAQAKPTCHGKKATVVLGAETTSTSPRTTVMEPRWWSPGNDTILTGKGPDVVCGGDGGFDTLESQDGSRDRLSDCGRNGGQALRDASDPTRRCKKQSKGKNKRSK